MKSSFYNATNISLAKAVPLYFFKIEKRRGIFKNKAFTLAETLITLSIVGVVSALTIPALMGSFNEHAYANSLKKAYSSIQSARKSMPTESGCTPEDFICADLTLENLSRQFRVAKEIDKCERNCPNSSAKCQCFVAEDGTEYFSPDGLLASFGVDINGSKGPNKNGRDVYMFETKMPDSHNLSSHPIGTIFPVGSSGWSQFKYGDDSGYWRVSGNCTTEAADKSLPTAMECTGRVLDEERLEY